MATVQRYVNTGSTAGGDGTTNATSGSTRAYASLSEWEANSGGSATDDYIVDCCGSTADTTSVTVDFATNITTGSITIRGNTGEADGFYDGDAVISTSHYRLDPGNVATALQLSETRIFVDGIQIIASHSSTFGQAIRVSTTGTVAVRRCRLRNASSTQYGIGQAGSGNTFASGGTRDYLNNLIVNFNTVGIDIRANNFSSGTFNIYHNTIYGDGSAVGINVVVGTSSTLTINRKGNALANSGASNDITDSISSGTLNDDANATEDYDLGTSGEIDLGTTADAWTSPGTSTSSDFTVKDASSSLNVTVSGTLVSDDIRGTTRSNYSVGCFEVVSAGGTTLDPSTGNLELTGHTPSVDQPRSLTPSTGQLTLTGHTPTITLPVTVEPTTGNLILTGYTPTIDQPVDGSLTPSTGNLLLTGYVPTIDQPITIDPTTGNLLLTGYTPTVSQATGVTARAKYWDGSAWQPITFL